MRKEIRNGIEWQILESNDSAVLRENSHAVLWDSSHAVLLGNSHADLWDSSHAVLWDSSHAELRGNSHADLRDNSHAVLRENSHAMLWDSSHAVLWENSHAVLWDSSHAVLLGNSHAVLLGNSHAVLWDSSHAVLRENSSAELRDFSIVHIMSKDAKAEGNEKHIIIPDYPSKISDWAKLKGIPIKNGYIHLFKCIKNDGTDFYSGKIQYLTDQEIIAPDWNSKFKEECGKGLHLSDSPEGAKYFLQDKNNYCLLEVKAKIKDCKPFGGQPQYPMKLRARACRFVKIIEKIVNDKIKVSR